ncbi:MAG: ribose 1,5-bisphosphate isomerase, partial [Candidatus Aminicenantes bacterium]|nr:ribose 1,5-bisphosphate isomerase [Candidatus Aminicenantes bacterium]
AKLHVDPLAVRARWVVDATGHQAEVARVVEAKVGKLHTPEGKIMGERAMWAEMSEKAVVDNSGELYPGVYVAGMAAITVFGYPRMGPIFGGMLLSGKKVAEELIRRLGEKGR